MGDVGEEVDLRLIVDLLLLRGELGEFEAVLAAHVPGAVPGQQAQQQQVANDGHRRTVERRQDDEVDDGRVFAPYAVVVRTAHLERVPSRREVGEMDLVTVGMVPLPVLSREPPGIAVFGRSLVAQRREGESHGVLVVFQPQFPVQMQRAFERRRFPAATVDLHPPVVDQKPRQADRRNETVALQSLGPEGRITVDAAEKEPPVARTQRGALVELVAGKPVADGQVVAHLLRLGVEAEKPVVARDPERPVAALLQRSDRQPLQDAVGGFERHETPGLAVQPEQSRFRPQPRIVTAVRKDADAVGHAGPGEQVMSEIPGRRVEQERPLVARQHPDHAGPGLGEIGDGKIVAALVHPHEIVGLPVIPGEPPRRPGIDRSGIVAEKRHHVVVAKRGFHPGIVAVVTHRARFQIAGIDAPGEGSQPQAASGDKHRADILHLAAERLGSAAERLRVDTAPGVDLQHAPLVDGHPQIAVVVLGERRGERLAPLADLERHVFDGFEAAGKVGDAVVLRGDPDSALAVAEKRIDRIGVRLAADRHVRHGVDLARPGVEDEQPVVGTHQQFAARKRQQHPGRNLAAPRPFRRAVARPGHFRESVGHETAPQLVVAVTERPDGGDMGVPLRRKDRQALSALAVELGDRAVAGAHENIPVRTAGHVGHGIGQAAVLLKRAVLGMVDEKALGLRADPDFAVAVLENAGDAPGDDHAVLRADAEMGKGVLALVVEVDTLLGPDPKAVFAVGAQRMDRRVQQSVAEVLGVIDAENNPVETAQTVRRTEPHESALVLGDAPDRIVRKAVVRVVTDQRIVPGRDESRASDQQKQRYDESFHK